MNLWTLGTFLHISQEQAEREKHTLKLFSHTVPCFLFQFSPSSPETTERARESIHSKSKHAGKWRGELRIWPQSDQRWLWFEISLRYEQSRDTDWNQSRKKENSLHATQQLSEPGAYKENPQRVPRFTSAPPTPEALGLTLNSAHTGGFWCFGHLSPANIRWEHQLRAGHRPHPALCSCSLLLFQNRSGARELMLQPGQEPRRPLHLQNQRPEPTDLGVQLVHNEVAQSGLEEIFLRAVLEQRVIHRVCSDLCVKRHY